MEVTVVRLRRNGVKIPREGLCAEPRTHGHLSIYYWHLKNHREDRKIKELILTSDPRATCQPIMKLEAPDQTHLEGMDMVYVGVERVEPVMYGAPSAPMSALRRKHVREHSSLPHEFLLVKQYLTQIGATVDRRTLAQLRRERA